MNSKNASLLLQIRLVEGQKETTRGEPLWWWNSEVSEAVKEKRKLYQVAFQTKKVEDKVAYDRAKHNAKKVVAKAKESEFKRFGDMLDREDGRKNIFRIAKQMTRENRDVTESSCIKGNDGKVITDEKKVRQTWKEYFDKLLNEEFVWDRTV